MTSTRESKFYSWKHLLCSASLSYWIEFTGLFLHRITGYFRLEGISKIIFFQALHHSQGHFPLDQAATSPAQPGLEYIFLLLLKVDFKLPEQHNLYL